MINYVFYVIVCVVFFFKQKTAYEMRISDWSSDVCSSDLQTVSRFNRNADIGIDPEFGRGERIFSRYSADPSVKPNPNLRALKFPPFYALDIRPGEFSTVAGVATDAHGQILKDGYSPVPGLYALGIDANSKIGRAHV